MGVLKMREFTREDFNTLVKDLQNWLDSFDTEKMDDEEFSDWVMNSAKHYPWIQFHDFQNLIIPYLPWIVNHTVDQLDRVKQLYQNLEEENFELEVQRRKLEVQN